MTKPILFLSSLFFLFQTACSVPISEQPDQIIELFRHGARGPLNDWDPSWKRSQYGVLTPIGQRQQYILGKILAEKYSKIFKPGYNYTHTYMISDDDARCIQSGTAHQYGMYESTGPALKPDYPTERAVPPFLGPEVGKIARGLNNSAALPQNVVPAINKVVDSNNVIVFKAPSSRYCPNAKKWYEENSKSQKVKETWKVFEQTINTVNEHLQKRGRKINIMSDVVGYMDMTLVDLYENRTLLDGLDNPAILNNMTWAFNVFAYFGGFGQPVQRELYALHYIQDVLFNLESFRKGKSYNVTAHFSGHDTNIFAVLAAFGVINDECLLTNFNDVLNNRSLSHPACYFPYFASTLIVELYNNTNSPLVKVLYNNVELNLCHKDKPCSYDEFVTFAKAATGNNTPDSYREKCKIAFIDDEEADTEVQNFKFLNVADVEAMKIAIVLAGLICVVLAVKKEADEKKYKRVLEGPSNLLSEPLGV